MLPGVGAFKKAMNELKERNLVDALIESSNNNAFILGICLGMQLLLDSSEEFGIHKGLGLIPGVVKKISYNKDAILPNVGFHRPIQLDETVESDWFYFIHSYKCVPTIKQNISSTIIYEEMAIVSSLKKDNVSGCQFHPEKSHNAGIKYYKNFIDE